MTGAPRRWAVASRVDALRLGRLGDRCPIVGQVTRHLRLHDADDGGDGPRAHALRGQHPDELAAHVGGEPDKLARLGFVRRSGGARSLQLEGCRSARDELVGAVPIPPPALAAVVLECGVGLAVQAGVADGPQRLPCLDISADASKLTGRATTTTT